MDVKDRLAQKREPNEIIMFIKEEFIDECSPNTYILNSSFDNEEIKTEPGDFAMCNSEAVTSQEDSKFSLDLVNNAIALEHLVQDGSQSFAPDLQIKRKRRKQRELEAKGTVRFARKADGRVTKTGRISRDEIFKNKKYFCSLCKKCYLGRKLFKKHFVHHFSFCENRYACLICNYTSRTVSHINRHILETHFLQEYEAEKLFSCTLCEKRFHTKKDLERHMFAHTGKGSWKCGECEYSCMRKYRLETHISSVHGYLRTTRKSKKSDSLFVCHDCNYSCKEKSSLRQHIKRHIGCKSYKCSECSYTCTAGGDLQKHCTIHSDDRPFVCNGCRKTFKRRSHLLIHFNGKYGCRGVNRKKNNSKNAKM